VAEIAPARILRSDHQALHTLSDILAENVRCVPQAPAARDGRVALNWSELARLSEGYAALLAARGIGFGDRVALWLPNCVDYLALTFA